MKYSSPASNCGNDPEWQVAQLCFCAARGDGEGVRHLVESGVGVNSSDYDRRTALHIAAAEGHTEVVQLLLDLKADVDLKDRWEHRAIDEAKTVQVQQILGRMEAVKEGDESGRSSASPSLSPQPARLAMTLNGLPPSKEEQEMEDSRRLCCAAAAGSLDLLKGLTAARADVNSVDYDGRSAMHVASAHGQLDAVKWLAEAKADVSKRDHFGLTPLAEAERHGHQPIARVLLMSGAVPAAVPEDLKLAALTEQWAIPANEVAVGRLLSSTIKSSVYIATWRGTKVVAKYVKDVEVSQNLAQSHTPDKEAFKKQEAPKEDSTKAKALEEMMHEIDVLSKLRHPDLVLFLGACLDTSPCFFLTEFMEGGDLENYYRAKARKLGRPYKPPWGHLLKWASAVARGLCFMHNCRRPIIHRDLKPLNLLLTGNRDIKVADFGISKLMAPKVWQQQARDTTPAPYMSGGVGTWRYMAPEVVRYEQYTDRVDIYSFALVLHFMTTGCQPFVDQFGHDPELVLRAYCAGKEPRPTLTSAVGTPELRKLMQDAWHAVPGQRLSAQECVQRLAAISATTEQQDDGGWGILPWKRGRSG